MAFLTRRENETAKWWKQSSLLQKIRRLLFCEVGFDVSRREEASDRQEQAVVVWASFVTIVCVCVCVCSIRTSCKVVTSMIICLRLKVTGFSLTHFRSGVVLANDL